MLLRDDKRIVLTLDAGGTNFVFNAVQGNEEVMEPVRLKARADSLEQLLKNIISGFQEVSSSVRARPVAISFCFPGPADYTNGIIGDLENLPHFRGGVPLKDMLEDHFGIPVFINNDGDLFSYGEALAGLLPEMNNRLNESGNSRYYRNLFGVTFGTGFGGGIVTNGQLHIGDNSAGGEINRMRNKLYPESSAEDSVSIRAVKRVYAREAGIPLDQSPSPREIQQIGAGEMKGNRRAALLAWEELAVVAGDVLANAITLFDSLVVIGGGLSGAHPLFMQRLTDEMNASFRTVDGNDLPRMEISALNLENENELKLFLKNKPRAIQVPFSKRKVTWYPARYIGVGVTRLGTSRAVSVGAYAYALNQLDRMIV